MRLPTQKSMLSSARVSLVYQMMMMEPQSTSPAMRARLCPRFRFQYSPPKETAGCT